MFLYLFIELKIHFKGYFSKFMSSVCFYFQVHQPYRLRKFSYLDASRDFDYFDNAKDADIFKKVANKCYLPANKVILDLIRSCNFRCAFSITGTAIEQMLQYAPEVLQSFQTLVATGAVEILAETYHHSLASIYDTHEFSEQIRLHKELIQSIFHVTPKVFRNTELIYDDKIGEIVKNLGFQGIITEGVDDILQGCSPNKIYYNPYSGIPLLIKNYAVSDDIAFRFSNKHWDNYPLTPDKFAYSLHSISSQADTVNLFMDYETFGEHQWSESGIFDFLRQMPEKVLANGNWNFLTPSEVLNTYKISDKLSYPRLTSWADEKRDLSAWQGNRMQRLALKEVSTLARAINQINSPSLTTTWRKLQTSDHFYYMSTSESADGEVHAYFSPYNSPYISFIRYMNVIKDFKWHIYSYF